MIGWEALDHIHCRISKEPEERILQLYIQMQYNCNMWLV